MKLLLLHGPATEVSRAKLISIKQEFNANEVIVFEKGTEISDIANNLSSASLFSAERLIILENPPEENFQFPISNFQSPITLIFWFDHEVSEKKPVMEWVKKNGQALYFPEGKDVSVFPFLDLLATGDKRAFLELDKLKKSGFEIQYFLTMTFYLLRNLTVTPKSAPSFVKQKLERQRKRFDLEKIKNLYKDIIEIDFKIKKGLLEIDQAEFILVNKFLA